MSPGRDDVWESSGATDQRKADGDIRSGEREGDAGGGLGEVFGVGGGGLVLGAEGEDVRAGEHPGVGLEKGGGADEGERGRVGGVAGRRVRGSTSGGGGGCSSA
jgi:hypothetical protein